MQIKKHFLDSTQYNNEVLTGYPGSAFSVLPIEHNGGTGGNAKVLYIVFMYTQNMDANFSAFI